MNRPCPGPYRFEQPHPGAQPWSAPLSLQQTTPHRPAHADGGAAVAAPARGPGPSLWPQYRQPPVQQAPNPSRCPAPFGAPPMPYHSDPFYPGNTAGPLGFVHPGPPTRQRRKPSWLIWGGGLTTAIAAVFAMVGFVWPGVFVVRTLDISQAQVGVQHILTDPAGYGAQRVSDVTCNDGHNPVIHNGESFTCQATIDRVKRVFFVTFTDDSGGYQVSQPHQAAAT